RSATPAAPRRRLGGALAVGAGILLSRLAGLVRDRVTGHYLGISAAAGAFRAALRIPNLLQNLLGEGVLSASFIPVYARLLAEGDEEEAGRVAGAVVAILGLVMAVLVAAGVFFAPQIVHLIASEYKDEKFALTVHLT